jgi:hypothetical protein
MRTFAILFSLTFLASSNYLIAQDETYICRYLFASSNEITQLSTDAISLAVDAVWEASGLTGMQTTTGTLTQSSSNPDIWSYSSNPSDKLVLNFNDGSSVEFIFYAIDGYTGGDEVDFKWSHQMDFRVFIQNYVDIRINSNTYPQNGKIYWQRTITGSYLFNLQIMSSNISHTGNIEYDIGNGYAFYTYREQATGNSNTGSLSVNVNEQYKREIGNNSNTSTFIMATQIKNNSSGDFSGTVYQYQNVDVFWVAGSVLYTGYYDKVIDSGSWSVQGNLIKNGQVYGNVQFDGAVVNGTYGPNLILHLNSGTNILLHTLIADPFTNVESENDIVSDFELYQNYPNPFNPSTKISWQSPVGSHQTLKVYDVLGNEVATLVDEYKPAGRYEVEFNVAQVSRPEIASGVYFYRLQFGSFVQTKKMVYLK